ncbi:MAG TPA: flagellar motor protein MotB [Sedimentisphaerales bacterium]|nr:flagellar motor protein MotB [Sedimentisphaerales bacterium]
MKRRKQASESETPAGAPVWMITFCDCMTLLLTFFVLFLSFSSFDDETFRKLNSIFRGQFGGITATEDDDREAFLETPSLVHRKEPEKGSEKPTLATETKDGSKRETESIDFRTLKVFSTASENIFWGKKGKIISFEGRRNLSKMAAFLEKTPGCVVVSENGPQTEDEDLELGLSRAWAVINYITKKTSLDKNWFSIAADSTVEPKKSDSAQSDQESARTLEIVLLERSIYE